MSPNQDLDPSFQVTVSFKEICALRDENTALKADKAKLQAENESLKKEIARLLEPRGESRPIQPVKWK